MDLVERGLCYCGYGIGIPWYSQISLPIIVGTIFADKLDGALTIVSSSFWGRYIESSIGFAIYFYWHCYLFCYFLLGR